MREHRTWWELCMTRTFTGVLLLAIIALLPVPVLADDLNATPTATATTFPTTAAPAPVASFIGDPIIGIAPLTVQFTDLSEGIPTLWFWDFGDGGSSTEQDPAYTYTTPGFYTVTLTSANPAGNSTSTGTGKITVLAPPSTQTPLSPLAVIMALGIAAFASAGIRGRKRQ